LKKKKTESERKGEDKKKKKILRGREREMGFVADGKKKGRDLVLSNSA